MGSTTGDLDELRKPNGFGRFLALPFFAACALLVALFFGEVFTASVPWSTLPAATQPFTYSLAYFFSRFIFSWPATYLDCWCNQGAIDFTALSLCILAFACMLAARYLWVRSFRTSILDAIALLSVVVVTFETLVYLFQSYWWTHVVLSTEAVAGLGWFTNADLFSVALLSLVAVAVARVLKTCKRI